MWTIKRDQEDKESEQEKKATSFFSELDKKYPTFKPSEGYSKLETISRSLTRKAVSVQESFQTNLTSLRQQMKNTSDTCKEIASKSKEHENAETCNQTGSSEHCSQSPSPALADFEKKDQSHLAASLDKFKMAAPKFSRPRAALS